MDRKFVPVETKATRDVPWHSPTIPKSQNAVATMVKDYQDQWVGHMNNLLGNNFPRTRDPPPPVSKEGRRDKQDTLDGMSHPRLPGKNDFPKTRYPAPSKRVEAPLHGEHDMADTTTTTSTPVNKPPHPHPPPNSRPSRVNEPLPAPKPFSIRQTFSAYPKVDLLDESLQRHRDHHSPRDRVQDATEDIIPETGSGAVHLQDPTHLLQRRLHERSRQRRNPSFSPTVLVHEYDRGCEDIPTRPEGTKFHDDGTDGGDPMRGGPWPRSGFLRRWNRLDAEHYRQAYGKEASQKRFRYDDVKKDYAWTTLEEAKDLSGREERMREKAMAKRQERLREEERGDLREA